MKKIKRIYKLVGYKMYKRWSVGMGGGRYKWDRVIKYVTGCALVGMFWIVLVGGG